MASEPIEPVEAIQLAEYVLNADAAGVEFVVRTPGLVGMARELVASRAEVAGLRVELERLQRRIWPNGEGG